MANRSYIYFKNEMRHVFLAEGIYSYFWQALFLE